MLKKGVVSTYEQWDKRSSNTTSKLGKEEKYASVNGGKDGTQTMQQPAAQCRDRYAQREVFMKHAILLMMHLPPSLE